MSYNFASKVAVITGGLSGIGFATAVKLLQNGAKVIIGDITALNKVDGVLKALKKESPQNQEVKYIHTDVSSIEDNQALVDYALQEYKGLDFVFANAGIVDKPDEGRKIGWDSWARTIDINLSGVFRLNKIAINHWIELNKKGSIVNTGSILSYVGNPGLAHYCSSKGGVKLLTKTLAIEYAARGIRVNSVNPAYIDTPLLDVLDRETYNNLVLKHPIGRLGKAEEVANTVAFLLSDEASFINGISLLVDGAYTAQ